MNLNTATVAATFDARDAMRRKTAFPATMRQDVRPIDVEIVDLSTTGFRAMCELPLLIGAEVTIGAVGIGVVAAEAIWADGQQYGFRFKERLPAGLARTISAADNVKVLSVTSPYQAASAAPFCAPLLVSEPGIGGIFKSIGLATAATLAALFGLRNPAGS